MANAESAAGRLESVPPAAPGPGAAPGGVSYGRYYYEHDCGRPYERNEHWLGFFRDLAQRIVDDLAPESVLDAGCAMGFLVEALRELGVDASGVDVSSFALDHVHESVRDHVWEGSLTDPLPRRYDLVTCIEVLEHLPAPDAEAALANLCRATDRLIFSSSPFDYGEPTHVNVRPPEEWSEMLARHGFVRDLDFELSPLVPWAALYRRTDAPLPAVVRAYDRSWWRLRYEVHEVRQSVLELQRRLEAVDWEHQRELEATLREREAELEAARARIRALEEPQRILESRSGRLLQAYHRVRAALRR